MMRIPDIIQKKRDGGTHSPEEIRFLISGYVAGSIPDYQISAWLMAIYFQGMTAQETAILTQAMAESGDMLDLSMLHATTDKHSTGGVGDKTSLVLAPMLAAMGLTVAKMSGRGLAHTGGTIDKLESIPGWRDRLSDDEFIQQAQSVGMALVGQSKNLAPADGLLYALRDVTATVDCIPLIASSIMSKKLASGAKTIVLDVKVGAGAFMKTLEDGKKLARAMVDIGTHSGRNVRAVLTDMDTPLGRMAGNALEVREAIETLQGGGAEDLQELCLELAKEALLAQGFSPEEAAQKPREVLASGAALLKLREFVVAQGGDGGCIDHPETLRIAQNVEEVYATGSGYVAQLDALSIGKAVLELGGGREKKDEAIDHGVGIEILKKPSQMVQTGDVLARIYHNGRGLNRAKEQLASAFTVQTEPVSPPPLILGVVH